MLEKCCVMLGVTIKCKITSVIGVVVLSRTISTPGRKPSMVVRRASRYPTDQPAGGVVRGTVRAATDETNETKVASLVTESMLLRIDWREAIVRLAHKPCI